MTSILIEFRNVSKTLGSKHVLKNVHLSLATGAVIGITGASGSGKSTLLRLASGLMYADHGEVWVSGRKVRPGVAGNLPEGVGSFIESPVFLPTLSGLQNLTMLAHIQGKVDAAYIRDSMHRVGLNPDNNSAFRTYSPSMRQRLGIAQAIMENPGVLLLDEPTHGLDRDEKHLFADLIAELAGRGTAVMISSHVQEDIYRYCDRVYSLAEGILRPLQQHRERVWTIITNSQEDIGLLRMNIPSFRRNGWINSNPAGICTGEWENEEELFAFLALKGIFCVEIRGEH
ncbi:ABC transporter ATP-binding protein [Paenibacillus oenotherae]|uniref:ABC transporter ATP-binding protein n=1 Tax=Paenibacillus oenotherae TaxID=1435645 RepID=A0ABS7DCM4_9BACL|nr:ABC transporter ATP-binding protein [Paenibacillus oenotherae]MBW7477252.1 ABC transporter ATP-binding protein [Paenibacillus oenotherae]